jgi:hypothetical protein
MDTVTVATIVERALAGLEPLSTTAEAVEDEWQYVTDLGTVWRGRLAAVAATRGAEPAPDGAAAAIEVLIAEAGRITDPHRAIDWLSTFPQVALAALGEAP